MLRIHLSIFSVFASTHIREAGGSPFGWAIFHFRWKAWQRRHLRLSVCNAKSLVLSVYALWTETLNQPVIGFFDGFISVRISSCGHTYLDNKLNSQLHDNTIAESNCIEHGALAPFDRSFPVMPLATCIHKLFAIAIACQRYACVYACAIVFSYQIANAFRLCFTLLSIR